MEEIVADEWANETIARLIAEQPSAEDGFRLLRAATVGLCGLRDDGTRYGSSYFGSRCSWGATRA